MDLTERHFHDPEAAREHLERVRWPEGPVCPHCGVLGGHYRLEGKGGAKGTRARAGLLKCGSCRKQFSVTVGTVFERSKIPLHKWLLATALLCSSKKGISSHQLHRSLAVTYKTAWFMSHRIREAMREIEPPPLGGDGSIVESDETFIGGKRRRPHGFPRSKRKLIDGDTKSAKRWGSYGQDKMKVLTLVERNGKARSFHVERVTARVLEPYVFGNVHVGSVLMTDDAKHYERIGKRFKQHRAVNHSLGEYVRGGDHSNTVENYFSVLKRGIYGVYQHVGYHHLKRYMCEFDFRYNRRDISDTDRTDAALAGIEGKRLTYAQPSAG